MTILDTAEAKRKLTLFNQKVMIIHNGNFRKQVFIPDHGFTLNMSDQSGTTVEKRGADLEATLAVGMTLRFFVQPGDGISFVQMGELYEKLPVSDEDKTHVREGVAYIDKYMDTPMHLSLGGEQMTNRKLFDTFMYGSLAHANRGNEKRFDKWIGSSPFQPVIESMFEAIVAELINFSYWLYGKNEIALQNL